MNRKAWLALVMVLCLSFPALAQKITVSGVVYDAEGEPAIGATVALEGQPTTGVTTDFDGNYEIQVSPKAKLVYSLVGCTPQTIAVDGRTRIDVNLKSDTEVLDEFVVVGYGRVKKSDATGSVSTVKPGEVEAGLATSAQDLLVGASPGVVVTTDGGNPSGGASIQIRGGASLSASNEPLVVIDGVPMNSQGVTGSSNILSLVNPESIESMTILKDASATAIYGSRASNGVIIITTKKGKSGKPQVTFAANFLVNTPRNYMNMMDGNEFSDFIIGQYGAESAQARALGQLVNGERVVYNTDWQKEVLRTSFSQDYTVSIGGTAGFLPYHASIGYTNNQGIIRGSSMERVSGSLNLSPTFFNDLLMVNANIKGAYVRNNYQQGPLGGAVSFNPTLPVKNPEGNVFNNWTTYVSSGEVAGPNNVGTDINTLQAVNPVSMIEDYYSKSNVWQSIGNIQFDLKMPFLRDLRANLNLGYDYAHGECSSLNTAFSPNAWLGGFSVQEPNGDVTNYKRGYTNVGWSNDRTYNLLLDFYLNYSKDFKEAHSFVDLTAGYSWQKFKKVGHGRGYVDPAIANAADADLRQYALYQYAATTTDVAPYQLVSFFARLNYTFYDRYMITATVRRDGTSRFGKDHRWGTFPAFALGWKLLDEAWMEGARGVLSELKLRAGYGVTGQQDLGSDYFPYLGTYYWSNNTTGRYPINGDYVFTLNPDKYNEDLKWEETHTWNGGIDFAFLNGRIEGSIDYYQRKTKDLLVGANYPAGSNLSNTGNINAGDLENYGIDFNVTARPVMTRDFTWTTSVNVGWNQNKITRLADGYSGVTGGIDNGVNIQKHEVGHPAYSFYVYEQVYDADGLPLEGVFVDQNGDGIITDADKIFYHSINPTVTATWNNNFSFKNWDLGIVLRGNFDNWVYNKNQANNVFISSTAAVPLSNLLSDSYLFQQTKSTELICSNYFVQNASFVRCDNITLGYTWPKLLNNKLRLRVFGAVQNPFVITKYKGLDPEVTFSQGIDNSVYPRPITGSLGIVATF
ncbi:MAG: TonB-dependent receptor [Muribaculaceae bacterium]|nr:TonB-dependent receptor [Muribaculaceae bacterium]